MSEDVWHPVIELHRTAAVEDAYEAAEEYGDAMGELDRIAHVEAGDGAHQVVIERRFEGGGGWVEIGDESNPGENYTEAMIDVVDSMSVDDVRLVFDYTEDEFALEAWVEPE